MKFRFYPIILWWAIIFSLLIGLMLRLFSARFDEITRGGIYSVSKILEYAGNFEGCASRNSISSACLEASAADIGWFWFSICVSLALLALGMSLPKSRSLIAVSFRARPEKSQTGTPILELWQEEALRQRKQSGRLAAAIAIFLFSYGFYLSQQTFLGGAIYLFDSLFAIGDVETVSREPEVSNAQILQEVRANRRSFEVMFEAQARDELGLSRQPDIPRPSPLYTSEIITIPDEFANPMGLGLELLSLRFTAIFAGLFLFGAAYASYLRAERRVDELNLLRLSEDFRVEGVDPESIAKLRAASAVDFERAFRNSKMVNWTTVSQLLSSFRREK